MAAVIEFVRAYLWLVVVTGCMILALGVIIGFLVGNISLRKSFYSKLDEQDKKIQEQKNTLREGVVKEFIFDDFGLGIIAYDSKGIIIANNTVFKLPDFLPQGRIPATIETFLDYFDRDNHLKANYLLNFDTNSEAKSDVVRANFVVGTKIYEIKILNRSIEFKSEEDVGESEIKVVMVEDITQVKDDERRQKDLAANVSHELKTPLTVIRASEIFVKNIRRDNMPTYEEITKWGTRIINNAIRMQDIVEDFLVLSMCSQTNKMGIFDINSIVEKAIAGIVDYPNADKVQVIPPKADCYPLLFGNSRLILRVVTNLLTNAVKYIDFDGKQGQNTIVVEIAVKDDRLAIQVRDNGRGIPQKDIEHLFERFYRVDNSGSRDVGGSGLGLAIAKEIADVHDGSINVVSVLGDGSTFTLILPFAATVFQRVYEDAKTGVLSENPYYEGAAKFLATEACEAARSKNYEDMKAVIDAFETSAGKPLPEIAKSTVGCISALKDDRFDQLLDELTYIDPSMYEEYDEFEEEYEDEEEEQEIPQVQQEIEAEAVTPAPVFTEPVNSTQEPTISEEDFNKKVEQQRIREMLLQPVVQQRMKFKSEDDESVKTKINSSRKENAQIHPKIDNKMYNVNSRKARVKNSVLFEHKAADTKEDEPEVLSAVRKVLDETTPIAAPKMNDDE